MPSIEFKAEIAALKKQVVETEEAARMYCQRTLDAEARAERAEHMARLWKRLAKQWFVSGWDVANFDVHLYYSACERAKRAGAELAALKKDARMLATWTGDRQGINAAIQRILEATEDEK
jgi:hypothetical protein